VQAPEGLKTSLLGIGVELRKAGIEAVLSCEPCFGACDLRDIEAKRIGCDLLLHIGHADFGIRPVLPVIYEEYRLEADVEGLLNHEITKLDKFRSVGLVTTVQYVHLLDKAKAALESAGKKVSVGKPRKAKHAGQILGCDQTAATSVGDDVDAFLFMGTGRFHAFGLAEATDKPVLFLDFESGKIVDMSSEWRKRTLIRMAGIEKAKGCRNFGILVSTKPGQGSIAIAEGVRKRLESKGRSAWVLAMDTITPEKLLGLKLDCLVNCSCPRLVEDSGQFRKPILLPEDVDKI